MTTALALVPGMFGGRVITVAVDGAPPRPVGCARRLDDGRWAAFLPGYACIPAATLSALYLRLRAHLYNHGPWWEPPPAPPEPRRLAQVLRWLPRFSARGPG